MNTTTALNTTAANATAFTATAGRTNVVTRLVFAAAAAVTTLAIFSSVVSISEPQRGQLMAQIHHTRMADAAQTMLRQNTVAVASKAAASK